MTTLSHTALGLIAVIAALWLVAAVAAPDDASDRTPQSLGEPQFDLPLSGWYWQLTRLNAIRPEVRSSRSLWDSGLPHLADQGVVPTTAAVAAKRSRNSRRVGGMICVGVGLKGGARNADCRLQVVASCRFQASAC